MREQGLQQEELEAQAGQPLPEREAMSIVELGDGLGIPPPDLGEPPVFTTPGGPADGPIPPDRAS